MLRSIVEDLSGVNAVRSIVTSLDPRLGSRRRELERPGVELVISEEGALEEVFPSLAAGCDATLVIAPELDGVLARRTRRVVECGGRVLGSSPKAVELAADKLALSRLLARQGISAAPLEAVDLERAPPPGTAYPAVLKPRFGAGSQWTYLIAGAGDGPSVFQEALGDGAPPDMVLGPLARGLPASASFLLAPGRAVPLLAGEQIISADGRFHYRGGRLPLPAALAERALRLAGEAARAVPGLSGFAGVDLVLGGAGGGEPAADAVLEVNPRLTTSYAGLRALARGNLAETWLQLFRGVDAPIPRWYGDRVRFFPDGRVVQEEIKKS